MFKVYGEFNIDSQEYEILIKKEGQQGKIVFLPNTRVTKRVDFDIWCKNLESILNGL